MTDKHLPDSIIDPELLKYLGARAEVDYSYRYAPRQKLHRLNFIDDKDLSYNSVPTYKYCNKIVLTDDNAYLLNRLYTYFKDNCGVAHLNDWHHIYALINTYPMLKELWDQFETALALCGSTELARTGRLG